MTTKWEKLQKERLRLALLATKDFSMECRKCGKRQGPNGFQKYLKNGRAKWCGVCIDCGGVPPADAAKALLVRQAFPPSLREANKTKGKSPKFKEGYGPDSIAIMLESYVAQVQQAYFLKGYAVALRTLRAQSKPLLEKHCWIGFKKGTGEAEFLKEQLLARSQIKKGELNGTVQEVDREVQTLAESEVL